uniref:Dienelactone hydrolase domain-containing protein n=1 Tax=Ditylenchus dipsaci TaxID=166011 RepID=A0A915EJF3_9BILA
MSATIASTEQSRVEYKSGDVVLQGLLCVPQNKLAADPNFKLPAVIVFHAFEGITEFEEEQTNNLAKLGYVAFAADVYGKDVKKSTQEEWFEVLKTFKDDRVGLLRPRLLAALEQVKSLKYVDADKIGAIGFCFGGLCALDLARINSGILAAVSFHGSFTGLHDQPEPEKLEPIQASVLVCHGDADTHVPMAQCQELMTELRARKADWQFVFYGNAKHGFTMPKLANCTREGVGYNKLAAERSWAAMLQHLNAALKLY